jgi:hypothetical protein
MQPIFDPLLPYNATLESSTPTLMAPCISNAFNLDMSGFMWNISSPHADASQFLPSSATPSMAPVESVQSREARILQLEAELRLLKGANPSS